ncbi:glycerate kinase [Microbacterium sp. GXF7504]
MHRVVVAPDSFKGTIRAAAAARALAAGWRRADPDATLVLRPMADGGEGTLEAFAASVPGVERMPVSVTAPAGSAGERIGASWLLLPPDAEAPEGTAVVELAGTCGIERYGTRREPWRASTRAFGEAIADALDYGVSRLVLAIGSSASTDAGAGMLRALGARITTASGVNTADGAIGLRAAASVDLSRMRPLPPRGVLVLTDVTAPLSGPRGAAAVFGPQKGFTPAEIPIVDTALARFGALFDVDPAAPGAGAAGGAGFALLAWGARLVPGADEVAHLVGLADAVATASVVITGEGAYDGQSGTGKAPGHVAAIAARAGVPAALVAGRIDPDADASAFAASVELVRLAGSRAAALAEPARFLEAAGAALARLPALR